MSFAHVIPDAFSNGIHSVQLTFLQQLRKVSTNSIGNEFEHPMDGLSVLCAGEKHGGKLRTNYEDSHDQITKIIAETP